MRKRYNEQVQTSNLNENNTLTTPSSTKLKIGEFLTDNTGKKWRLGKTVGVGGFGEIYLASDNLQKVVKSDTNYVAKVESHMNGPLFVEMNCYIRMAKLLMIEKWKESRQISSLGMPHYLAFGSHVHNGERFRFLILPRFDKDLEKILETKQTLNIKSVLTISSQIVDVLDYIHSNGYIHSDIKASNILLSSNSNSNKTKPAVVIRTSPPRKARSLPRACACKRRRNLREKKRLFYLDDIPDFENLIQEDVYQESQAEVEANQDQVYLLDYGLASKYVNAFGEHKPFAIDQRKAHAGTIIFCSCDAHLGVSSRRSDLESLGYNMIYWLTGTLPWNKDVEDPDLVAKRKRRAFDNVELFLKTCFSGGFPEFLLDYFNYLQTLRFEQKPDYAYCKKLFEETITKQGFINDNSFDFDEEQRWKPSQKKFRTKQSENKKIQRFIHRISRPPLVSNIPIKPLLRKKLKNRDLKQLMKWSQILKDPEIIIKQNKKKNVEQSSENHIVLPNIQEMDIEALNPTYAMIAVFNKCKERGHASPVYKSGDGGVENVEGYTPAMVAVLNESRRRREMELEQVDASANKKNANRKRGKKKRREVNESLGKAPPLTRLTKSAAVLRGDRVSQIRSKQKAIPLKRTYSLRG